MDIIEPQDWEPLGGFTRENEGTLLREPLVTVSPLGARPGPPEGVFGYGDANSPANPEYGDANSWEDKGSLGMVTTLNAPNTRRTSRKKTPSFR